MSRTARLAIATILLVASAGCFRANREAPVDSQSAWPTLGGEGTRSPFEAERIPETRPTEIWREKPHRGFPASPVVNGDALISLSTNRMVQALSQETGEIYWEHRKHGPFASAPVIQGDRIFAATGDVDGRVYAFRLSDGRERWEKKYPGSTTALAIDGDRLLISSQGLASEQRGRVLALRLENGEPVWQARIGETASGPIVAGDRILVGTDTDSIFALDREDGRIVGRLGLSAQISAAPAYRNGTVYVPLHSGELVALRSDDLSEAWRVRLDGPVPGAPVATSDGRVYVLDRSGAVWVVSDEGELTLLARLEGAARGALTITANGVLVGLLDGTLAALDRERGDILWTMDMDDSIYSPVVVHDGAIYVPLRRGTLVKLQ